jgi:hypothetical protein
VLIVRSRGHRRGEVADLADHPVREGVHLDPPDQPPLPLLLGEAEEGSLRVGCLLLLPLLLLDVGIVVRGIDSLKVIYI